ncbi:MAG: ThiF family adenylyltransferase [Candidatus Dormibacteraeota bacterium]|nr:ThiF family adenylyltransferase [Candidatus Dormibacteraeota bacterium]
MAVSPSGVALEPSPSLLVGRRTLEEIEGVEIVSDWVADRSGWLLELNLTPHTLGTAFPVPPTSRWFVHASAVYPRGLIDIFPAKEGGLPGIHPHQRPSLVASDAPYHTAKICVATDSEGNLRLDSDAEPLGDADRLAWHVIRALGWIAKASRGLLLSPGEPFELPVYPPTSAGVVAFREGPEDLAQWSAIDDVIGLAELQRVDIPSGHVSIVQRFKALDGRVLIESKWGRRLAMLRTPKQSALWLRCGRLVVLPPYAAPTSWGELEQAFKHQGMDLYALLRQGTRSFHDGALHAVLIGFPVPERIGEDPVQEHWIGIALPLLERQALHGFRSNELGLWMASERGTLRRTTRLDWVDTENWHPHQLATRGRLTANVADCRVAVIGAGALGSAIAEMLVRAGTMQLTIIDSETFEAGNLVRHLLTIDDLGHKKAEALARRLNAASPNARVAAIARSAEEAIIPALLAEFDLVIETTGDRRVLEVLSRVAARRPVVYASFSITLHARLLLAFLAHGESFPLTEFDDAYQSIGRAEEERGEERPWEGVGCWHPVFPARADEVWLMAAAAVDLLNEALPVSEGARLHVFERITDDGGFFTGLVKRSA